MRLTRRAGLAVGLLPNIPSPDESEMGSLCDSAHRDFLVHEPHQRCKDLGTEAPLSIRENPWSRAPGRDLPNCRQGFRAYMLPIGSFERRGQSWQFVPASHRSAMTSS